MPLTYESTRDPKLQISGRQAVLKGISSDGGLFVSRDLDKLQIEPAALADMDYLGIARLVMGHLLSGYTPEEIDACLQEAYTSSFAHPALTPLKNVGGRYVLELFHGPTSAFKDVALTLLPRLMSRALESENKKALILTATSGDTGKAAMSGFQDVPNTAICVYYPDGKVSAMQHKQMVSQQGSNVEAYGIRGNFDDAQSQVKKLFLDKELADELEKEGVVLSSANSINIGRLIPQIIYYFDAYRQLMAQGVIKPGEEISFSVPTGNFGDVLAGYYAWKMGLPVKKFYVASNSNNVLTDFLTTGVYDRNRPFVQTISPSMDILISSNLERLLFYASGMDNEKTAGWMSELAATGRYEVDEKTLQEIQSLFDCGWLSDEQTRDVIEKTAAKTGYILDPHSAIAYGLAERKDPENSEVIVSLSTASPYKFPQDVLQALHIEEEDEWKALHRLEKENPDVLPAGLAALETAKSLHNGVIDVEEMRDSVKKAARELFA